MIVCIRQTLARPASLRLSLTLELERIRFAGLSTSRLDSVCDINQTHRIMQHRSYPI